MSFYSVPQFYFELWYLNQEKKIRLNQGKLRSLHTYIYAWEVYERKKQKKIKLKKKKILLKYKKEERDFKRRRKKPTVHQSKKKSLKLRLMSSRKCPHENAIEVCMLCVKTYLLTKAPLKYISE